MAPHEVVLGVDEPALPRQLGRCHTGHPPVRVSLWGTELWTWAQALLRMTEVAMAMAPSALTEPSVDGHRRNMCRSAIPTGGQKKSELLPLMSSFVEMLPQPSEFREDCTSRHLTALALRITWTSPAFSAHYLFLIQMPGRWSSHQPPGRSAGHGRPLRFLLRCIMQTSRLNPHPVSQKELWYGTEG